MTDPAWTETLAKLVGSDAAGAHLVRVGENAVFRLASAPMIVRIARSTAMLQDARREVSVSHWLAAEGIPAVKAWPIAQLLSPMAGLPHFGRRPPITSSMAHRPNWPSSSKGSTR